MASGAIETIASGVAVAAIVSLTTLAYRKPSQFRNLYFIVGFIAIMIGTIALSWEVALFNAYGAIKELLPPAIDEAVAERLNALSPPRWASLSFFAFSMYMAFLYRLHDFLGDD